MMKSFKNVLSDKVVKKLKKSFVDDPDKMAKKMKRLFIDVPDKMVKKIKKLFIDVPLSNKMMKKNKLTPIPIFYLHKRFKFLSKLLLGEVIRYLWPRIALFS